MEIDGATLDAVIGLGSNLGDSRALLQEALNRIRALGEITAVSALYETEPVGPPQPAFRNGACRLRTELSAEALLDELLAVERALGRVRAERWGPRLIDLDILWIRGSVFETPRLSVPHPELRHRAFALVPLLDVAPDATDPRDGSRYDQVLASLGRAGVRQISAAGSDYA
jgi:2-amino-4-hydroxy-6-hydroxymethyldihydropteridine diphosphokinase